MFNYPLPSYLGSFHVDKSREENRNIQVQRVIFLRISKISLGPSSPKFSCFFITFYRSPKFTLAFLFFIV